MHNFMKKINLNDLFSDNGLTLSFWIELLIKCIYHLINFDTFFVFLLLIVQYLKCLMVHHEVIFIIYLQIQKGLSSRFLALFHNLEPI